MRAEQDKSLKIRKKVEKIVSTLRRLKLTSIYHDTERNQDCFVFKGDEEEADILAGIPKIECQASENGEYTKTSLIEDILFGDSDRIRLLLKPYSEIKALDNVADFSPLFQYMLEAEAKTEVIIGENWLVGENRAYEARELEDESKDAP